MSSLREQLMEILHSVLPKDPANAILGGKLLELVKPKLDGAYADSSIRQHFSVLAGDPESPIARREEAYGYYLRQAPRGPGNEGEREGKQGRSKAGSATRMSPLGEASMDAGRDGELEEKFRSVFIQYAKLMNQFPMPVEHTRAKRAPAGANRWKFPDVIVLEWDVGEVKDVGFRLDPDLLEVKRSLGEQPFRLQSVELKVELTLANFREAFFQCVSNSKWAHRAVLAVAAKIDDKTLAEELRRLGSSYDVTVLTYGLSRDALAALPPASKIVATSYNDEFENTIAPKIQQAQVATSAPRGTLDWDHIRDMRAQSQDFGSLFEWVSSCLNQKAPLSFDDFKHHKAKYR